MQIRGEFAYGTGPVRHFVFLPGGHLREGSVEPHMSEQWFVASTKLAPRARAAVPEMTQIFPENWMKKIGRASCRERV